MTSINNKDATGGDGIPKKLVFELGTGAFELNTEALGQVRCGEITGAIRDYIIGEFKETDALDGPTFVRGLLSRLGRRIEEGQETSNNTKIGSPLSETDIQHLLDTEIESFAHEIVVHHTWLFKNFDNAMVSVQTEEKCEHVSSDKRRNVNFPKKDGELDSDYLVRVFDSYITEVDRHLKELFKSLMKAPQHFQNMIDLATTTSRMFTDQTYMHRTWLHKHKSMQYQVAAKFNLGAIANQLTAYERLIAGINLDGFRRTIALPEFVVPRFTDSIIDMTAAYGKLTESIRTYSDITRLPRFVLPGATREVSLTRYAVNALGISDEAGAEKDSSKIQLLAKIEEETSTCIDDHLKAVDLDLARAYAGSRDALHGTNPDRERHFLSSMRELWNHLLRKIAPDEQVLEWIPKDGKDLLHEGKPTRKARVLYVCRDLNHGPLNDFIICDTRALVELINLFNRVHQLERGLSAQQIRALQLRSDSWLIYILDIWKESQQ